jgi:ABC-type bacteriocin/lantibiotic exporter with double-glycine peptidase domain
MSSQNNKRRLWATVHNLNTAYVSGVAVLKAVLEGYGIAVSDAQVWASTGFAGEELTVGQLLAGLRQAGLGAEQQWLPADGLVTITGGQLPLLVLAQGETGAEGAAGNRRYLLLWQKVGEWWQVMDPVHGRVWRHTTQLQTQLTRHEEEYSLTEMGERYNPDLFRAYLVARLRHLGLGEREQATLLARLQGEWEEVAVLDTAVRFIHDLVAAHSLRRGKSAYHALTKLLQKPLSELSEQIPSTYWTWQRGKQDPRDIHFYGWEFIQITGLPTPASQSTRENNTPHVPLSWGQLFGPPEQIIWENLREDGWLTPTSVVSGVMIAALSLAVEAFLLQGLLQLGQQLSNSEQRLTLTFAITLFFLMLLLLLVALNHVGRQQGRRLEARLRMAFLQKIPRLPIQFFQRAQVSGLTQRGYMLRTVHGLPDLAQNFLQTGFQMLFTAVGIIWLHPTVAPLVILLLLFTLVWPYLTQPIMAQRSFALAQGNNNLSQIYLDSLLGGVPVRVHSAEQRMWRRYQGVLVGWVQNNLRYFNTTTAVQLTGLLTTTLLTIGIVWHYITNQQELGAVLLITFWAISIPTLGQKLVETMQEYLQRRAIVQMLLQPLLMPDAVDLPETLSVSHPPTANPRAAQIELRDVVVAVDDTLILSGINLKLEAGEQVAVVGPSGAGKSTLASLLLGWHTAVAGEILVDGIPLQGEYLELLRRETAWVDPAVQLWNRTLLSNLWYANQSDETAPLGDVVDQADLFDVLQTLPEGLQTLLGENGRRLSGGQGQRVRLGRAMLQKDVRLVIMDEPFRGLDRDKRALLLARARAYWPHATMLCITHDVGQTEGFNRVLLIENGQIVEDASPEQLRQQEPQSRYMDLLQAEEAVRRTLWESTAWKRLHLAQGVLHVQPPPPPEPDV